MMAKMSNRNGRRVVFSTRGWWGAVGLGAALTQAVPAMAVNVFWDDAGGSANKNWSNFGNWSPDGDVQGDDVWVGTTTLGVNFAGAANDTTIFDLPSTQISSLTVGNGADVDTNQNELIVNGATTVGGAGSSLILRQHSGGAAVDSFDTNSLTVNSGGAVSMFNGRLEVDSGGVIDLNAGGTIIGTGTIDLEGNPAGITSRILNDGTITANTAPFFFGGSPVAGTLLIRAIGTNAADARFDWDGGGNGTLQANGNQTLDIDVNASNDPFSGTMNLNTGSTIDIANTWSLDSGTINANTAAFGLIIIGQDPNPGAGATIAGGNWTMSGGSIVIADEWDTLIIDSTLASTTGGTVDIGGTLQVDGVANFDAATNITTSGTNNRLVVNGTVTIDQAVFDWDGLNQTTVNDGGFLDINSADIDTAFDGFDSTITINGGTVRKDNGAWVLEGAINMDTSASDSDLSGAQVSVGDTIVDLNVTGTGNADADFNAPLLVNNTLDVNVAAGATLDFNNNVQITVVGSTWDGGAGSVLRNGNLNLSATTTYNFSGGTVKLDDGNDTLNAQLNVNAASIDTTPGDGVDGTLTINNSGALIVNLDGDATWQMDGILNYNGDAASGTIIGGTSAVEFQPGSSLNVTGEGAMIARAIFEGTVSINSAGEDLELFGGTTVGGNTNVINGATINGPGQLAIDSGQALLGNGTINAQVRGDGSARLIAENGQLNVNGTIADIGTIGTVTGGTLNVTDTWNTNITSSVLLQGGTISGSTITNDGAVGINGRGLVTSNINNSTRIDAEGGGTLVIDSPFNVIDWDGSTNNGSLNALTGNLTVRDNAIFVFAGTVQANSDRQFFADGFELRPGAASDVILNGGTFRSTNATLFQGNLTTGAGSASTLNTGTLSNIGATASFTLNGNLNLDSANSRVQAGAFIGGGAGDLVNLNGGLLQLDDGAAVSTVLINQGGLNIASGNARGNAIVQDFDQTAAGEFNLDISETGLGDFDRLSVSGSAFLAGELDVDFVLGFAPNVGDTFAFMTYLARNGTFDSLDISGLGGGLDAIVSYTGTAAILEIVNALIIDGDYNSDGFVSQVDLDLVLLNWGDMSVPAGFEVAAIPGGGPFDGLISQNELDGVLLNWGNGSPPALAIPEPTTAAAMLSALVVLVRRRR